MEGKPEDGRAGAALAFQKEGDACSLKGMDAILEPLVASPGLPRYVETLTRLLTDERARREHFYEAMTEQ